MKKSTVIAVDLAKSVFEIGVSDRPGRVRERYRLSRARLVRFFSERQPTTVLMEACGSAHHWGRRFGELGHRVVLLSPHQVRRYREPSKTDRADVDALLEAWRNKRFHPVPVKSPDQQALAALHRQRSAWMTTRTARLNAIRAYLREFGLVIPVGARCVLPSLWSVLEDAEAPLPAPLRVVLAEMASEINELQSRIRVVERQLTALSRQMPAVEHLLSIPGIGLLSATALVGFVGEIRRFRNARRFASYLGLTPREHSSGHVRRLGTISKRGDRYLRTLLVHGGRSVLRAANAKGGTDRLRAWGLHVAERRGHNRATVALANKLARIVWSVWTRQESFQQRSNVAA